jgi:hypothetical protein
MRICYRIKNTSGGFDMKRLVLGTLAVIVFGVLALGVLTVQSDAEKKDKEDKKQSRFYKFNEQGELERPEGYRLWIFVGTPVTPNSLNNGKAPFPEFHNVYIDPKSYRHYSKTGEFPEGTIEPGNWAYFSFTNKDHSLPYKELASAFPAAVCNSCHAANAADDWVFTQYYPVLRAAKPKK